jgi:hypothetical protein
MKLISKKILYIFSNFRYVFLIFLDTLTNYAEIYIWDF